MAEAVDWGADGTPRSPQFDDVYRPADTGLAQACHVFLGGCNLPRAWAGAAHWRILETGFGLGQNFLATWHAWQQDEARPRLLHYVSLEAWPVAASDLLRAASVDPQLVPLAQALARQWDAAALTRRFSRDWRSVAADTLRACEDALSNSRAQAP